MTAGKYTFLWTEGVDEPEKVTAAECVPTTTITDHTAQPQSQRNQVRQAAHDVGLSTAQ